VSAAPIACVVSPNRVDQMETFVRAHVERLPTRVRVFHGGWLPELDDQDRALMPGSGLASAAARVLGISPAQLGGRLARAFPGAVRERAVADRLRAFGVRVCLAEYGPTGVAMRGPCGAAGVPLIVQFHGFDAFVRSTLDTFGRDYPQLFAAAAAVVAVSNEMAEALVALGAPRERVHVIPCGVDLERFRGADPGQAPPVFVATGRFVAKKAPHATLRAFARAAATVPEARLVMIGDGELRPSAHALAAELGVADRVSFPGSVPPEAVAEAMRAARAFVQHSVVAPNGDREGTPVSVLEAAASGLPVVATRHGGIREAVVEGETGLLVDEGDVEGMAGHLVTLARDPARAAALGAAGRRRAGELHSLERSIARLWQVMAQAARA